MSEPTPPRPTSWWVDCTREEFDRRVAAHVAGWKVANTRSADMTDTLRYSWDIGMTRARKLIWNGR